jgi:membrane-associated protease RseP (regulator of RpoE activity)
MEENDMEDSKRSKAFWIVLALLGLVLSTGFGALAGGAAGYWLGRRSVVARIDSGATLTTPQGSEVPEWPWGNRRMPGLQGVNGATVTSVTSDSPAEKAGIQVGDVITAVDGESVGTDNTLQALIGKHKPGDTVKITLQRQGADVNVTVKLGSKSDQPDTALLGISYVMATPGTQEPTY